MPLESAPCTLLWLGRQLECLGRGYNIGIRLIDEFLAKSKTGKCIDFRDTADKIAKVHVFRVADDTSCDWHLGRCIIGASVLLLRLALRCFSTQLLPSQTGTLTVLSVAWCVACLLALNTVGDYYGFG